MATKSYAVFITVTDNVTDVQMGHALVKGIQDGDAMSLNFLARNVVDITVGSATVPEPQNPNKQ